MRSVKVEERFLLSQKSTLKNAAPHLIYGDVFSDKYARVRFEMVNEILSPFLKDGIKILDLGCYTADLLNLLPPTVDYYGVDFDEKALEIAEKRGAYVVKLDLENEKLQFDKKFGIILTTEILEHLKDPEKLVLQVKNLLEENGVVLISLPNECTLYHRLRVFFGKGLDGTGFEPFYHLHFPTIKQSNEFVGKHFRILEKRHWVHVGVGGSAEKILSKIPIRFWAMLAEIWSSLFARGIIFLCGQK